VAFTLPDLPYPKDALAPYMSAETLDYHHDKHHLAYVETGNKLVQGTGLEGKTLDEVVVASFKDPKLKKLFNNAGQHWNHLHFWKWMKPKGGGAIPGELEKRLVADFGSLDEFKAKFVEGGVGQFGSGWVWLIEDAGKLAIMQTPNGENPLAHGKKTVLGCDVWEHSYYIDYRNKRADYLKAWIDSLVNWDYALEVLQTGGKVEQTA
jgi:superoxide dismutase, Fe-Mn family